MNDRDAHELAWWRSIFLCRFGRADDKVRVGQPLYGRRFYITEVMPDGTERRLTLG